MCFPGRNSVLPDGVEREGDGNGRRDPGVLDYPLFYEYVVRNLDCYTSEQRKGCQVEYVITGKNTERKCVSSVAARLFAIRYLMDQTMALTEPKLQKEAETLAAGSSGLDRDCADGRRSEDDSASLRWQWASQRWM